MKALTDQEQCLLLESTEIDGNIRDHALFALAMGTGLRVFELVALDVSNVYDGENVKPVIELNPRHTKGGKGGIVVIPLRHHRVIKLLCDGRGPDDPLFVSRGGGRSKAKSVVPVVKGCRSAAPAGSRLSKRAAQALFAAWQERLGFDRHVTFHMLRYTFCWNFWRSLGGGGDLVAVQKAARHARMMFTADYVMVAAIGFDLKAMNAWLSL